MKVFFSLSLSKKWRKIRMRVNEKHSRQKITNDNNKEQRRNYALMRKSSFFTSYHSK